MWITLATTLVYPTIDSGLTITLPVTFTITVSNCCTNDELKTCHHDDEKTPYAYMSLTELKPEVSDSKSAERVGVASLEKYLVHFL